MTTAYTSLLGLALPVTGELSGTWGDTVNTAITALLDTAVAGTTSITTDADITLTTTTGASNQARQAIILWNPASGTVTRNITAPAQSKMYTVINASGGTQSIVIRGVGPTTGVTVLKGESALVAWNGSDFVKVSSIGGSLTLLDLTVTGNTILGDAAADTLTVNATSTFNAPVSFAGQVKLPSTGRSAAAALTPTNPAFLYGVASTYTDTASSGTLAPVASFYGLAQPTLSTSNVTTYTSAATLYIANAPTTGGSATITNPYSLYIAAGAAYLGGGISGSTVFNDGTANGVAYLNGSKVLTTGSALTFDGTSAIGLSNSNGGYFRYTNTTNTSGFDIGLLGGSSDNNGYIYNRSSGGIIFAANNSEQMRLTSTGLGIGTSSPAYKLSVYSSALDVTGISLQNASTGGHQYVLASAGQNQFYDALAGSFALRDITAGATRLIVDSSGNLLVGTTSAVGRLTVTSAASQEYGTFDAPTSGYAFFRLRFNGTGYGSLGQGNAVVTGGSNTDFGLNATNNMLFSTGGITERMRIDSSGNLLVGRTSSSGLGQIQSDNGADLASGSGSVYLVRGGGNVGIGTTSPGAALEIARTLGGGYGTGLILNDTASSGAQEGMHIEWRSGTDKQSDQCRMGQLSNSTGSGSNLAFYTNSADTGTSTEKMRISAAGNLLVGTTTATGFFNVTSTLNGYSSYILNTNASFTSSVARFDAYRNTTNGSYFFIECSVSGVAQRFGVLDSGAVLSATLLGGVTTLSVDANGYIVRTVSDAALKTNVAPITYGLDTILKLKPIKHEWVESANMGGPSIGFIAQEMELEVPEIVSGTEYKSIDYPKLTAILTKAIQEQQALITSLTARITALEST